MTIRTLSVRRFGDGWQREAGILAGLLLPFAVLLLIVFASAPNSFDRWSASHIQSIPWGGLSFIPTAASEFGGGTVGFFMVPAVAAIVLAVRRDWRGLGLLAALFVLHFVLISPKVLMLTHRPSPVFGVEGGGGFESFPSGHTQWAVSFYGFLAYLALRDAPRSWRPAIVAAFVVVAAGTMVGRIELGRHWPVDTVAGALVGLVAVRLVILVDRWFERRSVGKDPIVEPAAA